VLLHEQDRTRWDPERIAEGFVFLERSARGERLSRFHLEAAIAANHAKAASTTATDWAEIVRLYDLLRAISPSPVVDVNRALAVAMLRGAAAGLDEPSTCTSPAATKASNTTPTCWSTPRCGGCAG